MTAGHTPGSRFAQTLAAASAIIERGSPGSKSSELDAVGLETDIPVDRITAVELKVLGADGNQANLFIHHDGSAFARIAFSGGIATVFQEGELEGRVPEELEEALSLAISHGDPAELMAGCAGLRGHLVISLRNDPAKTGFHYIEHVEHLVRRLGSAGWHTFVSAMLKSAAVLVVGDLGDVLIRMPELEIRGTPDTEGRRRELDEIVAGDGNGASFPSPAWVAPASLHGADPRATRLVEALNGVACCLVYAALAHRVDSRPDSLSMTFSGARVVRISGVLPERHADVTAEIELFDWAGLADDPAKHEAVQQAASLTLTDTGSFAGAATFIHRTARSTYEVARRNVVAEALATRRTARSSAIGVALESAKLAREIVTKSVERTFLQIVAAVGLVIANAKDVLGNPVTAALFLLLVLLMLLSWLISYRLELASASDTIASVSADLQEYRDSLSEEDVAAIRNMQTIAQAAKRIRSAKRTVAFLSAVFIVMFTSVGIYYATGHVFSVGPAKPATAKPLVNGPRRRRLGGCSPHGSESSARSARLPRPVSIPR